jgi:hypothetical protein
MFLVLALVVTLVARPRRRRTGGTSRADPSASTATVAETPAENCVAA